MDLGVHVLKLPEYKIQRAMYDKKEIRSAAHMILGSWLKEQSDRHEAYNTLHRELQRYKMNMLAAVLKQSVEGIETQADLTSDSE